MKHFEGFSVQCLKSLQTRCFLKMISENLSSKPIINEAVNRYVRNYEVLATGSFTSFIISRSSNILSEVRSDASKTSYTVLKICFGQTFKTSSLAPLRIFYVTYEIDAIQFVLNNSLWRDPTILKVRKLFFLPSSPGNTVNIPTHVPCTWLIQCCNREYKVLPLQIQPFECMTRRAAAE